MIIASRLSKYVLVLCIWRFFQGSNHLDTDLSFFWWRAPRILVVIAIINFLAFRTRFCSSTFASWSVLGILNNLHHISAALLLRRVFSGNTQRPCRECELEGRPYKLFQHTGFRQNRELVIWVRIARSLLKAAFARYTSGDFALTVLVICNQKSEVGEWRHLLNLTIFQV